MRGIEHTQRQLFSYVNLEKRTPVNHALRPLKVSVDGILKRMDHQLEAVYSKEDRSSIPPERLLRASLLQVLFTIRSERQLVEHIEYNLVRIGGLTGWWSGSPHRDNIRHKTRLTRADNKGGKRDLQQILKKLIAQKMNIPDKKIDLKEKNNKNVLSLLKMRIQAEQCCVFQRLVKQMS